MMQPGTVPPPMVAPPPVMDHQQVPQQQYQQPWMMMQQPPPQAVAPPMWNPQQQPPPQQQMMPPQPQIPPPQYQSQPMPPQQQLAPQQQQLQYSLPPPTSADEVRTLWIGDLQFWMTEEYLTNIFAPTQELVNVKLIRNKQTQQLEGYGFIEFRSRAAAERILQAYNGTQIPGLEQTLRLNWASFGMGEKRPDDSPDFTIFVGDLAADVTDYTLQETFRVHYPSVKGAKVVTDRLTGHSKGYGFVKFGDESEQLRAMSEMNGTLCSTRPMRIGPATNKKTVGVQQYSKAPYQNAEGTQNESDPENTTIFVGGLDSSVAEDHLRQVFSKYGELVHVKIPVGKRCGFVQFSERSCAEEALRMLNGMQLGGQNVRLSWGRNPSNRQPQQDPNAMNGGYNPYAQGYGAYGYAPTPAPQDPNMYYGGYPGYANYQQPQQQMHVPQQQMQPPQQ